MPKEPAPSFRYDLPSADIQALTNKLIATKNSATDDRVVCYRFSGHSQFSDIARHIECKVFQESFAGNDAAFMTREYGPYERASTFFLSVERMTKTPIGALRIIRDSPAGFKTLNDIAGPDSPAQLTTTEVQRGHRIDAFGSVWDVGTVAILNEYRRTGASASLQLYRGMYVTALKEGIDHLIAIIDKGPLLAMTDYLAIPFVPLCESSYFSYLGSSESRAVYGYIPEFDPIIKRRLAEVQNDPSAVRALNVIINGTHDRALLFDDDYK
jgi:hypothetical protein